LKWAEEVLRMGHSAPVIGNLHEDLVPLVPRVYREYPMPTIGESADAVGNQIEKNLHETWTVSPHER
jgi:hypothetical protein